MQVTYDAYSLFPLFALAVALVLVLRAWRYRSRQLAVTFMVIMLALAWWSFSAFMERTSLDLSTKIFWIKMTYPGVVALPVAWLVFALQYTDKEKWITRGNLLLVLILPLTTLALVWTDSFHHLIWKTILLNNSVFPPVDSVTHNTWFWINAFYAYLLILFGDILLLRLFLRSSGVYRRQVGIMLLGTLAPWVANLLFIIGLNPFPAVDPTPLAFAVTGIAFFWGLSRLHLLDILPVAQEEILKSMVDGVIVLDNMGRVLELNPSAERIIGLKKSNVLGKACDQILPLDSSLFELAPESTCKTQNEITMGEGSDIKHYAVYISCVTARHQVTGNLILLHDDTQRKRAESEAREKAVLETELFEKKKAQEQLKISEEKYSTIVEKGNDGIVIVQDGVVKFANGKLLEFIGMPLENTIGKPFTNFISPEFRKLVGERYQRRLLGEDVSNKYEIGLLNGNSVNVPVEINATKIEYEGKPADMAMIRDIAERKKAEETLKSSEAKFRNLVQNAASGILMTLPDGRIISANKAAAEIYGYSSIEQLCNMSVLSRYANPDDRKRLVELITEKGVAKGFEALMVRQNGTSFWAALNVITQTTESGKKQFISIIEDISDRKNAEAELARLNQELRSFNLELETRVEERTQQLREAVMEARASNHAKSEFLASMSHELRTPLNAIIGFSQVLHERYFGSLNEKQEEYVTDILDSGRHLLALINDILDLSKVEAGKMEIEKSKVRVKDILNNSLMMIKEKAQVHNINLEVDVAEPLKETEIMADERRIKQVMFNLLSNSAKFTPDGGTIRIEAKIEGGKLITSVSDTGIGISPEEQKKLFTAFYQASGGIKDKTPGTGLGLSITKSIVEKHGGRIWVESEGRGKGSRFSFTLPVGVEVGAAR